MELSSVRSFSAIPTTIDRSPYSKQFNQKYKLVKRNLSILSYIYSIDNVYLFAAESILDWGTFVPVGVELRIGWVPFRQALPSAR